MKNLKIILLGFLVSFLIISCDKEDMIEDEVVAIGGNGVVTGFATVRAYGIDTFVEHPSRETLVFLGKELELANLDSVIVTSEEVYVGDGWYATRTNGDGEYFFEDLPAFEDWKLCVITSDIDSIEGVDITLDGDEGEELIDAPIHISLKEGEVDDGNNFLLSYVEQTFTQITGLVSIDNDGDGLADDFLSSVLIRLLRTDETGDPSGLTAEFVAEVYSNSLGQFSFQGIDLGFYVLQFSDPDSYSVIKAADESPDSDPLGTPPVYIPVFLDENKPTDEDNNFLLEQNNINIRGKVILDTLGGVGAENQRVELYRRGDTGVPMSPLISSFNTDNKGNFWFAELEPNDYILYFIGDGTYSCLNGTDITPEMGEPEAEQCFFISVDIPAWDSEDSDNIFIVQ